MTGKTLGHYLASFLTTTPLTRRYSEETISGYGYWTSDFLFWLWRQKGAMPHLSDFTEETSLEYSDWKLTQRAYRPRSVNAIYGALRAFGGWLVERKHLPANPALILKPVPLDDPIRHPISTEEAFAMIEHCDRIADPYKRLLYRALLAMMIHGGVREAELKKVCLKDVSLPQASVLVRRGKGGKKRVLYLSPTAVVILQEYLAARPAVENDRFFILNRTQHAGYRTIRKIIREAKVMADIDPERHFTVHSFRHDYITRLGQNGGDIASIAQLAGHKNPSTTLNNYFHTDEGRVRAVANLSDQVPKPPEIASPPAPLEPAPAPPPADKPHLVRIVNRHITKLRNERRLD